jgi:hypothetical protein
MSHLLAYFSLIQTCKSAQVFSELIHEFRKRSFINFLFNPIFIRIKVVMEHSQCLNCAFLILSVLDGLGQFKGEDTERKHMHSIAVAELARMGLT